MDPQFGPCTLVGLGGRWTEALGEAVVVAGPGSRTALDRALETRGWGRLLLRGDRGRTFPVRAVWEVSARLVALLDATGLDTIEINPLFLEDDRAVAVDALVVPRSG
jgi:acetyltransferase